MAISRGEAMKEQTVREYMHSEVVACSPDTSAEAVVKLMDAEDVSAIVVVSEETDVVGVISRTDLVDARFVQPHVKEWREMKAEHLMSWPVVCVAPGTSLPEAARLLRESQIHRLVVVEEHGGHTEPVGILSLTDLVKEARESDA